MDERIDTLPPLPDDMVYLNEYGVVFANIKDILKDTDEFIECVKKLKGALDEERI